MLNSFKIMCRREPFVDKFEVTLAMATIQWLSSYIFFVSGPLRCYTRVQSSAPLSAPVLVGLIRKYKVSKTETTVYLQ